MEEEEEEGGQEEPSKAEEEGDKHLTKKRLNVSNAIDLDIFNMNIQCGRRKQMMQKWRIRKNMRKKSY